MFSTARTESRGDDSVEALRIQVEDGQRVGRYGGGHTHVQSHRNVSRRVHGREAVATPSKIWRTARVLQGPCIPEASTSAHRDTAKMRLKAPIICPAGAGGWGATKRARSIDRNRSLHVRGRARSVNKLKVSDKAI